MPQKILFIVLSLIALAVILVACGGQAQQAVQEVAPTVEAAVQEVAPTVEAAVQEVAPTVEAAVEETQTEVEAPTEEAAAEPAAGDEVIKIGFLAGVQDPFYFTMQRGAELAAADLGIELVTQIPDEWNATVQTPMLDALVARGDLDFLFLAPVDKEAMVAPLQAANDAGLPLLTVDTFIGDGDYAEGPVTFPLSYIGSDNVLGGYLGCQALAEAMGGAGKAYIQNVKPGISTTDQREEGCRQALDEYPDIELVGVDYNNDDPSEAQAQVQAILQREPDLGGIFGTNVFSAQGAGQVVKNSGLSGVVKVVAFDATELAIELLRDGTVDLVIAQKPADMGYLAVAMAQAYLDDVASIPKRIPTGYAIITQENVEDPEIQQFFYTADVGEPESTAAENTIAFLAGVQDPFYFTMQRGAQLAADNLGSELVVQIPEEWNATVQTPMLDALVARGDLDFLFLAPVDKEAMVAPLQAANDAGLPLLTVDTFIGDGDYAEGPVTFPLSYIGSDNVLGGYLGCQALAEAMGGAGKAYIQNVKPGISTTDQREEGCRQALDEYPDIELVGVDYNNDDPSEAQAQVQAILQREPDLGGIFGTNVFSAQGAGQVVKNSGLSGVVKVVAFDATELAIELLRDGTVDLVIAQKPADMGYLATMMATAYLNGVTSIPERIPTGYAIINQENVDDPAIAKYIYTQ
ncbi:MAG: ABC transporter substrate-binding protein [Candidatus Promineifilaceae bacterium]|jgi:ribose transport system substrate-binding protein